MNEARRQHYLKAMGVPVWYSRFDLPGAMRSPDYDFSGFDVAPNEFQPTARSGRADDLGGTSRVGSRVTSPSAGLSAKKSQARLNGVQKLLHADRSAITQVNAQVPTAALEAEPAASVGFPKTASPEVPEFALRIYRLRGTIVVNESCPDTDSHRESALLANLATTLWGLDAQVEQLLEFVWPVFANRRLLGQEAHSAREVLSRILEGQVGSAESLVLFGRIPVWRDVDAGMLMTTADLNALQKPLPALRTWSLGELLIEPQRKKEVWQHLQSILPAR